MAAWGSGSFENDRAFYWAVSLKDSSDFESTREAIKGVLTGRYIAADEGWRGIAACEALAIAHRAPPPDAQLVPEEVIEWARRIGLRKDPGLVELAVGAMERIQGSDSELREIWVEADDPTWASKNRQLADRLRRFLGPR